MAAMFSSTKHSLLSCWPKCRGASSRSWRSTIPRRSSLRNWPRKLSRNCSLSITPSAFRQGLHLPGFCRPKLLRTRSTPLLKCFRGRSAHAIRASSLSGETWTFTKGWDFGMRIPRRPCLTLALASFSLTFVSGEVRAQEEPLCVENSPERRGEIGCSIIETRQLPADLKEPVFWHIDRFQKGELARGAVGPTSIAFEAHEAWWLMAIGPENDNHHGGEHIAQVKLSPLPPAQAYSMRVLSAYIPSGMT